MGFTGRIIELRWPGDHALHDMKVDIRPPSVAALDFLGDRPKVDDNDAWEAYAHRKVELCAEHVVTWNLEDGDGQPLPRTGDALRGFDGGAIIELLDAWADNARVPNPSKAENPASKQAREPIDPLAVTSAPGSPMGSSSAVEASIPVLDVPSPDPERSESLSST
ncbi:hypothetical protein [Actinosynnema sp. NPDC023587]|uniref:hypothetical protein n=1 Tax=Actinosynnema sp. NPDC023587 TaxID=3154695 RepID=UPI0033E2BE94